MRRNAEESDAKVAKLIGGSEDFAAKKEPVRLGSDLTKGASAKAGAPFSRGALVVGDPAPQGGYSAGRNARPPEAAGTHHPKARGLFSAFGF